MIEWNDGLSLGVKTLDSDHRNLLDMINQFSQAIDENAEKHVFEELFSALENYALEHFDREEALMRKCNCDDVNAHAAQHDSFTQKIPSLRESFFASKDYMAKKETSLFLTDWLINHIINEDMHLIKSFKKCGLIKEENQNDTWLGSLLTKTTDVFTFTKRMLISAMIPLFGMLILSGIIVNDHYEEYKNIEKVSKINYILSEFNDLAHELQIERGLSSGHLSSSDDKFLRKLHNQRNIVDITSAKLIKKIDTIDIKKIGSILPSIEILKIDISTLKSIRKRVDKKTTTKNELVPFYTSIIKNIISVPSKIALINSDMDISYSISLLSSMLNLKEVLGQQRAIGTMIIEQGASVKTDYNEFLKLLGAQKTFRDIFSQISKEDDNSLLNRIMGNPTSKQIKKYKETIKNETNLNLDSKVWFDLMTAQINDIKYFIDLKLEDTNKKIDENLNNIFINLLLSAFYALLIIVMTKLMIYMFEKSTKKQITQLTDAMKHLALGGRNLKLSGSENEKDEISQIYNAYELTRKELLKGDIITQLYLAQERVKLDNEKQENLKLEEMAFIDPLTTTMNRRKFEELSESEIRRSLRYKHDLSFLMLDIDHFKNVNDTYGHSAGDEVLKQFSDICKNMVRDMDIIARIGGEEFVIMLLETNKDGAMAFADRLRQFIYDSTVKIEDIEIKYTVSIGVSLLDSSKDDNLKTILERADQALYQAKEMGRNKVVTL